MYKIVVIGGGVIGLTSALSIQKQLGLKAKVVIFTNTVSPNTTGDVAAGLWFPYLIGNTPEEKVIQWAKITQDYVLQLWRKGKAQEAGITLQPGTILTDEGNYSLPEWLKISLGHKELSKKELKQYNEKYKKNFSGGYIFITFTWEASKFLPYLEEKFQKRGGEIQIKQITNFEELYEFDVIVNCTGLYSRNLVPDLSVHPVRGQVSRVYAPWQFHVLLVTSDDTDYYVIPNHDCVILGGTHQANDFNTDVNEEDKRRILSGCYEYVPSLINARLIKDSAGLRPGRNEVRVELEYRKIGEKVFKIVHNYGHGGSGITLSVGCAFNATELVKEALGISHQSKL